MPKRPAIPSPACAVFSALARAATSRGKTARPAPVSARIWSTWLISGQRPCIGEFDHLPYEAPDPAYATSNSQFGCCRSFSSGALRQSKPSRTGKDKDPSRSRGRRRLTRELSDKYRSSVRSTKSSSRHLTQIVGEIRDPSP